MKMLFSLALSTFFHALGVGGVIFFASLPLKSSLVQTGDGSVEMEFVVQRGGGQQILSTSESTGQAFTGFCSPVGIVPERGQAQSTPPQCPLSVRGAGGVIDMPFIPMTSEPNIFFEKRMDPSFSPHPGLNEEEVEEEIEDHKNTEIYSSQNRTDPLKKSQAQSYIILLPQVSGAWVLLDEKEGLYPPPKYPRLAILKGWEGETIVQLDIDNTGKVADIRIVQSCGHSILDESVVKTLKTWHFEKGNDRILQVPVRFVLKRS